MAIPEKILSRKDEITAQFLDLMEQHVADVLAGRTDVLLRGHDFAARLFIHHNHLTNTIKLTTGKSPCEFMEERVLHEAQKLLLETDLSVSDIAYKFGYREPTNFIKFFRNMCGTTPLRYRKQNT